MVLFNKNFSSLASSLGLLLTLPFVAGHGLVEDPPSRNQICGVDTKPHEVWNNVAGKTMECGDAFDSLGDRDTTGYSFMSVLTHDLGRKGVSPLPSYVCGFESETWFGGATPWDAVNVDWPVTDMTAGENTFTWNIEWGPHFDDTEEFVYYITKADFVYDASQPLTWDDFESTPFCDLSYVDSNPTGNAAVTPDKTYNKFETVCDVPARSGRHVIYAEWGRNYFTYERFHGCIDVQFGGSPATTAAATTTTAAAATSAAAATTTTPAPPGTQPRETFPTTATTPAPPPTTTAPPPTTTAAPPPPPSDPCDVSFKDGRNPWFAGFDIGFDTSTATLDFSGTGLDLSQVTVQAGNFAIVQSGQTITLTAPSWVSLTSVGYLGMNGNNVPELASMELPTCTTGP